MIMVKKTIMESGQMEIFEAFKNNVIFKISPYLQKFGFNTDDVIREGQEGIGAEYTSGGASISLGFSFHHLDYADGIVVSLKSKFGNKILRNEVLKKSNKDIPVYFFGL